MHVRELPGILFREEVTKPQELDVRDFMRNQWDHMTERDVVEEFPEGLAVVGETADGFWLRLRDPATPRTSSLTIYESLVSAMHGDGLTGIYAGNVDTGVWAYGRGEQSQQTVWCRVHEKHLVGAEKMTEGARQLEYVGKLARRAAEILADGTFEEATFFKEEVTLPNL